MNYVTYETAVLLKEVGFPQPEPEFGQVWFSADRSPFVVGGFDTPRFYDDLVFAPTATDIMRALPGLSMRFHSHLKEWQTRYKKNETRRAHKEPAEACALAWLYFI